MKKIRWLRRPGTVYQRPDPELGKVFRTMERLDIGPYTDEFGAFISAFAPVVDKHSGEVLMVVGIDMMADQWKAAVARERLRAILLTLLLTVIVLGGTEHPGMAQPGAGGKARMVVPKRRIPPHRRGWGGSHGHPHLNRQ